MSGFIITTKSQSEYKFLFDLLKKLGIHCASLSEAEIEDLGLSHLMKKADRTKKVSRESVMRKLRS